MSKKIEASVRKVIDQVLWTAGASAANRKILAEAIAEKLHAEVVPLDIAKDARDKGFDLAKSLQAQVTLLENALKAVCETSMIVGAKRALDELDVLRDKAKPGR